MAQELVGPEQMPVPSDVPKDAAAPADAPQGPAAPAEPTALPLAQAPAATTEQTSQGPTAPPPDAKLSVADALEALARGELDTSEPPAIDPTPAIEPAPPPIASPAQTPSTCSGCGAPARPDARFCSNCGLALSPPAGPADIPEGVAVVQALPDVDPAVPPLAADPEVAPEPSAETYQLMSAASQQAAAGPRRVRRHNLFAGNMAGVWKFALPLVGTMAALMFLISLWSIAVLAGADLFVANAASPDTRTKAWLMLLSLPVGLFLGFGLYIFWLDMQRAKRMKK